MAIKKTPIVITIILLIPLYFIVYALYFYEDDYSQEKKTISPEAYFKTLNYINSVAREIWTKNIVGQGMDSGLKFGEEWLEKGVDEGPLPALFFRFTASRLAKTTDPKIRLYLSSPSPINPSNLLTETSLELFEKVEKTREPVFDYLPQDEVHVAMFPDFASVKPCVVCHNEHPDSPKTDWKLNDVMGAAVWLTTEEAFTLTEYINGIDKMINAIEHTYQRYLEKTRTFKNPPVIGEKWPKDGYFLPNAKQFITLVESKVSEKLLTDIIRLSRNQAQNTNQPK